MISTKRNAIILAAGTSSRFVPLSMEKPKGLLDVKGEILIERQIKQLKEANIDDIIIVVGYKAEMFSYLKEKFGAQIVFNEDFYRYNNISSIIRVADRLVNTYICSSDNYFPNNVFLDYQDQSYYSAVFADGPTKEYCLTIDANDNIVKVNIGGANQWYMIGPVFFNEKFSEKFRHILIREYNNEITRFGYWEDVYIRFLDCLPKMRIRRYKKYEIEEFDTIDELREFDNSYYNDTRSVIVRNIAQELLCYESELSNFKILKEPGDNMFSFDKGNDHFCYNLSLNVITRL